MSKTDPNEVSKISPRRPAKKKAVKKAPAKPRVTKEKPTDTTEAPAGPTAQTAEQSQSVPGSAAVPAEGMPPAV